MSKPPTPPKHLTAKSRAWFAKVCSNYELESQDLLLLQGAAEAWDLCQRARELIAAEGLTFKDRHGNLRPHPAAQIARDQKTLFARLVRELALDIVEPEGSRPPKITGRAALKLAEG